MAKKKARESNLTGLVLAETESFYYVVQRYSIATNKSVLLYTDQ